MENESIQAEIAELTSLRRQISIWRSSLVVLAVVIVLVCVLMMRSAVTGLAQQGDKQTQFATLMGTKMQEDILPKLQEVGAEAVRRVDINKQIALLNKRAPEVANASMKEARLLATNVRVKGHKVVSSEFEKALQAQAATLKREFPDATDEQLTQLMDNLVSESKNQIIGITGDLFTPHITAINNIVDDIAVIKAAEGPAASADIPTWEMAFLLVDIVRADFEPEKPAVVTKAAGKEKKQ
ncbi:MAG: hypothetical protein ACYC7E_09605 [Armatimonadota bacterium]